MRNSLIRRAARGALALAIGLLVSPDARAGGLRCSPGEVVIENLKIGQSYSLQTLAHLPLSVTNTGDQRTTVLIEALVPDSSELRQGAQPVPAAAWATARPDSFVLAPQETRLVEMMLSIPDDERLLGGKFEVIFWSHTLAQPGELLAYGLKSRVIFTIDKERGVAAVDSGGGELSIEFLPSAIFLKQVVRGREYRLENSDHKPLVVRNTSSRRVALELQPLSAIETGGGLPDGYEDLLKSANLKLSPAKFSLGPGEERTILGTLFFPKGEALKGKDFMCMVSAAVVDLPVRTQIYSRIHAHVR